MIGDIKHIVIFQSLQDQDKKTGEVLYDEQIRRPIDFYPDRKKVETHKFHNLKSADELIEWLKYYQTNAKYLIGGIVLHFEMHGNTGLLACADGSSVTWEELDELLRPINVETKNNLFITMAACYGRYVYKKIIDLRSLDESNRSIKKSACSGFISASKEVSSDEIEDYFGRLFEKMIECGNIVDAHLRTLEEKLKEDGKIEEELIKLKAKNILPKDCGPNELILRLGEDKFSFYYTDVKRLVECSSQSLAWKLRNDPSTRMSIEIPGMTEKERELLIEKVFEDQQTMLKHAFDFS
jgi:hypothetical protein